MSTPGSADPLIERFRRACIDPKRKMFGGRAGALGNLARLSATMSQARAFSIEDPVAELAADLSRVDAQTLLKMSALARPPHTTTWIEYSPNAVARRMPDHQPDDQPTANRFGYLLETLERGGHGPIIRVSVVADNQDPADPNAYPDDACGMVILSLLFDPDGEGIMQRLTPRERLCTSLVKSLNAEHFRTHWLKGYATNEDPGPIGLSRDEPIRAILGSGYLWDVLFRLEHRDGELVSHAEPRDLEAARTLAEGIAFSLAPNMPGDLDLNSDHKRNVIAGAMRNIENDFRVMVPMLGLLNSQSIVTESQPGGGMTRVRGRPIRFLAHHRVRLGVPKARAERAFRASLESRATPRAHEVRGTLCYSRDTRSDCSHDFQPVDGKRLQRCRHCGGRRWWRGPHIRGDAGRGFITKDYHVERRP